MINIILRLQGNKKIGMDEEKEKENKKQKIVEKNWQGTTKAKEEESERETTAFNKDGQQITFDQRELKGQEQKESQQRRQDTKKMQEQRAKQLLKWKKLNSVLQRKRQVEFQLYKKKLEMEKEQQQTRKKEDQQRIKVEKRENLMKKIDEIQKRKVKRTLDIEKSKKRTAPQQKVAKPLYLEKQREFQIKKIAEQTEIKKNILKKKQQMMVDIQEIKQHQKNFVNHLKQRFKRQKSNKKLSNDQNENFTSQENKSIPLKADFIIFPKADPDKKKQDLEKYLRRKKFQEKIKTLQVVVDEEKMKQAMIAKDKSKNPLKYNYLSNVAALTDEKIFDQFKQFEINIDRKQLGNQYMRQIHDHIPLNSRIKAQSQSQLKPIEKVEYKNYMPQVKSLLKKKVAKPQPNNEIQQIIYRYENNSDRVLQLNRKSEQYKNEVLKKIREIRSTSPTAASYSDYLGKQKQIDEVYMKSIKVKLATAQIS